MKIDENDFRRRFAGLRDEALLSIDRKDLVDRARESFDEEVARRGLEYVRQGTEEPVWIDDDFVPAATFLFPDEAEAARGLLRSCDIVCYLENEHTVAKVWPWSYVVGGLRLMVPGSLLGFVREVLNAAVSEEDLHAAMEAHPASNEEDALAVRGRSGGLARTMLVIGILLSPAVESLRLFYL